VLAQVGELLVNALRCELLMNEHRVPACTPPFLLMIQPSASAAVRAESKLFDLPITRL
jgi:hypothetical protein